MNTTTAAAQIMESQKITCRRDAWFACERLRQAGLINEKQSGRAFQIIEHKLGLGFTAEQVAAAMAAGKAA